MKKNILNLLFILICCNKIYSQEKTQYQKKYDEIMSEMCKAIGVKESLIEVAIRLNDWDMVKSSQDFAIKSKMLDKNELLVIVLATSEKLKEAEKIKSEIDFKREKLIKEKQKIEAEKKEKLENYQYSDYFKINERIKKEMRLWATKGEFEKMEEYSYRMFNKEQEFDKICINVFSQYNKDKYENSSFFYEIEFCNYDADKELLPIKIFNNWGKSDTLRDTLRIKLDNAKKLKELARDDIKYRVIYLKNHY